MRTYRLVVFDFDGTLADSFPRFLEAAHKTTGTFGVAEVQPEMLDELRTMSAHEIMTRLAVPAWKVPMMMAYARWLLSRKIEAVSLFPGVRSALDALSSAGVRLAIVSSNSRITVRSVLGPHLLSKIDHFECGSSLFGKARKLVRVLEQLEISADEAVYVGDEIRDLHAARTAGIAFAAVGWGYTLQHALAAYAPEHMLSRISDIQSLAPQMTGWAVEQKVRAS